MKTMATTRRGGFSLIELLTVISILALLMAISAGAYFRIRSAQDQTNTEATMSKINTGMDKKWKAVLDQSTEEVKQEQIPEVQVLIANLNGNKDLARTIWAYIRMRSEFPTTFREAQTPLVVGFVTFQPRKIFLPPALPLWSTVPAVPVEEQSAACLYIALTQSGNRGETFGGDGTGNQARDLNLTGAPAGTLPVKVYMDSWNKPLAFCRMGYSAEVQNPPFSKVPTPAAPAVALRDPFDPTGQIVRYAAANALNAASLASFWSELNKYHMTIGGVSPAPALYAPQNWVPTTISAGRNQVFGAGIGTDDDLLSYRLRREGTKGD